MRENILILLKASVETIYMVFNATFISVVVGLIIGCVLFITAQHKTKRSIFTYRILAFSVNTIRSLPFIILLITVIPLTRFLVGTSIGTEAAIVPLAIAAIPFFARVCENALADIPQGLIETSQAMGASTWQTITKILLPESLPTLIRGATLTCISLIGYSAMAGVVGGGGLGELAVNYGYQRFDALIMFETIILLLVFVQVIQWGGDYLAAKRRVKPVIFISIGVATLFFAYHFWSSTIPLENSLQVGVMSGWSEEVMKVAVKEAEQAGLQLKIVTFNDYVQPNTALSSRSIDVNIFQHQPYLDSYIKNNPSPLIAIAKTFVYPMGFYSHKIKNISALKNGALVVIPNDPSNGSRALLLLQKFGLITLREGVTTLATVQDIVSNPQQLQFKLLDAAQLPRSLSDADLVAITNDFLNPAGLTIKNAIIKEGSDSHYANLIVVREKDKQNPAIKTLVQVMHSKRVIEATQRIFPDGTAIPAW